MMLLQSALIGRWREEERSKQRDRIMILLNVALHFSSAIVVGIRQFRDESSPAAGAVEAHSTSQQPDRLSLQRARPGQRVEFDHGGRLK